MEIPIQGGCEQQIPPQATTIAFGLPDLSYDPTTKTGVGKTVVFAPVDFFMTYPCSIYHPWIEIFKQVRRAGGHEAFRDAGQALHPSRAGEEGGLGRTGPSDAKRRWKAGFFLSSK